MTTQELNPDFAKTILGKLSQKGVEIAPGLTPAEFDSIEALLGVQFPPDLRILLSCGVIIKFNGKTGTFPQWHKDFKQEIDNTREWISQAFSFDIAQNNYWHPLFGVKPNNDESAIDQALAVVQKWPPLIRIYGHRYMPTEPHSFGNPILSVWQASDTVYYDYDLIDYLVKEFKLDIPVAPKTPKRVPYWTDVFGL